MKVIYFDCFGVLFSPVYTKLFEKYIPDATERAIWVEKLVDLDLDRLSEDELVQQLSKRVAISQQDIWQEVNAAPIINQELFDFIQSDLKDTYKVGLLTNIGTSLVQRIMSQRLNLFDPTLTLISSELGVVKPDPRIFQIAIEKAGVEPSKILFIDDREENIEAAKAKGLNGIVYKDFDSLKQELGAYL